MIAQSGSARCRPSSPGSMRFVVTAHPSRGSAAHFRRCAVVVTIPSPPPAGRTMAIDVYWGSGSPYAWRVLLTLEYKRLTYLRHLLQTSSRPRTSTSRVHAHQILIEVQTTTDS